MISKKYFCFIGTVTGNLFEARYIFELFRRKDSGHLALPYFELLFVRSHPSQVRLFGASASIEVYIYRLGLSSAPSQKNKVCTSKKNIELLLFICNQSLTFAPKTCDTSQLARIDGKITVWESSKSQLKTRTMWSLILAFLAVASFSFPTSAAQRCHDCQSRWARKSNCQYIVSGNATRFFCSFLRPFHKRGKYDLTVASTGASQEKNVRERHLDPFTFHVKGGRRRLRGFLLSRRIIRVLRLGMVLEDDSGR